jgi:hypothetical protein
MFGEPAKTLRDVIRDGGLLGNDECFGHSG